MVFDKVPDPDWAHHCGDLWRDAVIEATGRDICDAVGPSPRSIQEWAAMMRRTGSRSLSDVISFVHGSPVPLRQARRGDVVRKGWAIGICQGEDARFFGGVMETMSNVDQAWSVKGWRHG